MCRKSEGYTDQWRARFTDPDTGKVLYENKELTIEGKVAPRHSDVEHLYSEYGVGDFHRTFTIGELIDVEKITAEFKHGAVTVHLPKSDGVKPRRIEVKASERRFPD